MLVENKKQLGLLEAETKSGGGGIGISAYQKALNNKGVDETLASSGVPEQIQQDNVIANQEQQQNNYYDLLKNESYKTLLNSQIQAAVARDQALKYTNNQLRNSGYGSQGLAQSSYLGIQNNYANALANANQQYANDLSDINKMQIEEQKENEQLDLAKQEDNNNANYENYVNLLTTATTKEQLDDIKAKYGNLDMTDAQKRYTDAMYKIYADDLSNVDNSKVFTVDQLKNTYALNDSFAKEFQYETDKLATLEGRLQPNDIVYMKNGDNNGIYVQYNGNGFIILGSNIDPNLNAKYSIVYDKKNNAKVIAN